MSFANPSLVNMIVASTAPKHRYYKNLKRHGQIVIDPEINASTYHPLYPYLQERGIFQVDSLMIMTILC